MQTNAPAGLQGPATADGIDLEPRDIRALTQYLTVLEDAGRAAGADDLFLVVSESGSEYLVDRRSGACECPDATHRDPDGGCKHVRRVALATGERAIPAEVDPDALDEQLGDHVSGEPQTVATDGGTQTEVIDAGDEGVILDEAATSDDGRPEDCSCWDPDGDLPCWPCYQAGFETTNPAAEPGA